MKFFTLVDHGFLGTLFGLAICWLPQEFDCPNDPGYAYKHVEVEIILPFYFINLVLCYGKSHKYDLI